MTGAYMRGAVHGSAALHANAHAAERVSRFAGYRLAAGNSSMQQGGCHRRALRDGERLTIDGEINEWCCEL